MTPAASGLLKLQAVYWPHLCNGQEFGLYPIGWWYKRDLTIHRWPVNTIILAEEHLSLLARAERVVYLARLFLQPHILKSRRALTPWTSRPFSSSVARVWDLLEQLTPSSINSLWEGERDKEICLLTGSEDLEQWIWSKT